MIDPFGRHITYLRLSVTDRCDFRCQYCMAEDMAFLPKNQVLSLEELTRLCDAFMDKGIRKIRLTGGEPLVRKNIMSLINELGKHIDTGKLDELTLTTNGSQLSKYATGLFAAGIRRINVSLDTLDAEKFRDITRRGNLPAVLDGISAAKEAGLAIKINMVALKGFNDCEFDAMIEWCGREGHDLTLIETMPLGEVDVDRVDQYLSLLEVREKIETKWTLSDNNHRSGGPARYADIKETNQKIGFITPMSHNFCADCNRIRVTCTGELFMCLGHMDRVDLRTALRRTEGNDFLDQAITQAVASKPERHHFIIGPDHDNMSISRHMSQTGG